jgi:hypothetical protein
MFDLICTRNSWRRHMRGSCEGQNKHALKNALGGTAPEYYPTLVFPPKLYKTGGSCTICVRIAFAPQVVEQLP